jgi:hypothetical protein
MDGFVRRANTERYHWQLLLATDEAQRQQFLKLLAEEEAKDHPAPQQDLAC